MALKKSSTTFYGHQVENAYIRVEALRLNKKDFMSFNVKFYVDVQHKPFEERAFHCDYDISGANPIAQAYQHLKTLPEFAGATDC